MFGHLVLVWGLRWAGQVEDLSEFGLGDYMLLVAPFPRIEVIRPFGVWGRLERYGG